jgi:hypothetical protein
VPLTEAVLKSTTWPPTLKLFVEEPELVPVSRVEYVLDWFPDEEMS